MVVADLYWILEEVGVGDKLVGWLGSSGEVVPRRLFLAVFVFGLQTYYITTFFSVLWRLSLL